MKSTTKTTTTKTTSMTKFNTSMFQSIKDALKKNEEENSANNTYSEILKTSPGNTYTVRLLPNSKDIKNTFFEYQIQGWVSFATGQYVQAISPATFGERDPIAEERYKILRTGSEDDKAKVAAVRRSNKVLVNVYVIDDPTNPDNNGKVKILRYGKQLQKIIMEAIDGEDAEEYGEKIFDLSADGVSFKIKCENQGDYPTYVSSRFTTAGKTNLTESQQEQIYNSTFDLTKVFSVKGYDELKQMFDEHYYCKTEAEPVADPVYVKPAAQESKPVAEVVSAPSADVTDIDDEIDNLLKDL
jgi:hypothetical protein